MSEASTGGGAAARSGTRRSRVAVARGCADLRGYGGADAFRRWLRWTRCVRRATASHLGGMVPMYLLMSAFHSAPWLKLIVGRT